MQTLRQPNVTQGGCWALTANDCVSTAGWAHVAVVNMTTEFCCGSVTDTDPAGTLVIALLGTVDGHKPLSEHTSINQSSVRSGQRLPLSCSLQLEPLTGFLWSLSLSKASAALSMRLNSVGEC